MIFRQGKICTLNEDLFLDLSPISGSGVYSRQKIRKDEVIETCPLLIFTQAEYELLKTSSLYNYYFLIGADRCALALGYGSVYNHFYPSNARFEFREKKGLLLIRAIRNIPANTEITINYHGDPAHAGIVALQNPSA